MIRVKLVRQVALQAALFAACVSAPPPTAPPVAPLPPPQPEPQPPEALPCHSIEHLVVEKAGRTLLAYCSGGARRSFRVALGRDPHGPKLRAGDLRTPEGEYRIAGPPRVSRFHRFLPIDYPSRADAETARRDGRVSADDQRRIVAAHEQGRLPPSDTPLGGALGFHGEGRRWRGDSRELDWTYGCIALADEDIDFLIERVQPGTPVSIRGAGPAAAGGAAAAGAAPARSR